MKQIIFLFLATIISACSVFEDEEIIRPIPVDSIFVNSISNHSVDFTAAIFCGSMCWKNTYFEKNIVGGDIFLKTFAISDGSSVCPAVCVEVETPINIILQSTGRYTFHFWKSDTSSIDTIIVF